MRSARSVPGSAFDAAYGGVGRLCGVSRVGAPPWETGAPQADIVALAEAGLVSGKVLDIGCGTGENALFLAERGLEVLGVDASSVALEKARDKASERRLAARFWVCDALGLAAIPERFDTVVDSGFLHTLSDADIHRLIDAAKTVLRPGGTYHLLCFSKRKRWPAPRRFSRAEILQCFGPGWRVESIVESRYQVLDGRTGPNAWLCRITRL